jgi:hypothetical protein
MMMTMMKRMFRGDGDKEMKTMFRSDDDKIRYEGLKT